MQKPCRVQNRHVLDHWETYTDMLCKMPISECSLGEVAGFVRSANASAVTMYFFVGSCTADHRRFKTSRFLPCLSSNPSPKSSGVQLPHWKMHAEHV